MDRYINGYICPNCIPPQIANSHDTEHSLNDRRYREESSPNESSEGGLKERGSERLRWNEIIAEVGGCLMKPTQLLPMTLMKAICCILQDISEFDYFWYNTLPESLDSRIPDNSPLLPSSHASSSSYNESRDVRSDDENFESHHIERFRMLYDPSSVPVLLPPILNPNLGIELDETFDRMFLKQRSIPPHLTDGKYR